MLTEKQVQKEIDSKLKKARKYIDEAYKIAKENEGTLFNPIADLFTDDEIEDCGWDGSHC